jgi:hypothetical protein
MEIHIKIKAQRFKNTNESSNPTTNWKSDGIQKFKLFINREILIKDTENCIISFKKILDNMSNERRKYQYIDYEIMDPVSIPADEFEKIYKNLSNN